MKGLIWIAKLAVLTGLGWGLRMWHVSTESEEPVQFGKKSALVLSCYDGDTCRVKITDTRQQVRIRLVGIDTPELGSRGKPSQAYSQAAQQWIHQRIVGQEVLLKLYGQDRYGRWLGEIFHEDLNINLGILEAGLARTFMLHASQIDAPSFQHAQSQARSHERGIWSIPDAPDASRYRRQ